MKKKLLFLLHRKKTMLLKEPPLVVSCRVLEDHLLPCFYASWLWRVYEFHGENSRECGFAFAVDVLQVRPR